MKAVKGLICLDIDGTITSDPHSVPLAVIEYFQSLYDIGWRFVFITGRTFSFAKATLKSVPFPFYFSVQNGADLIAMPEKKLVKQNYLSAHVVEKLDEIYEGRMEDYLIYSGFEKGDFCFYRPHRFSKMMTEYLELMMTLVEEPWQAVESFAPLKHQSFPLIKCIGTKKHMEEVALYLQKFDDVCVSCIKDPLSRDGFYVNLITDRKASKGSALRYLRTLYPHDTLFIAAGDDRNDISLLDAADVAIGMHGAPSEVLEHADIIAPSADEMGIIQGLKNAMKWRGE
jgi:hypothetical protein